MSDGRRRRRRRHIPPPVLSRRRRPIVRRRPIALCLPYLPLECPSSGRAPAHWGDGSANAGRRGAWRERDLLFLVALHLVHLVVVLGLDEAAAASEIYVKIN